MLLRSASTPVFGTLHHSTFSDSPNRDLDNFINHHRNNNGIQNPPSSDHNASKPSFSHSLNHLHLTSSSSHSPPISKSVFGFSQSSQESSGLGIKPLRRAYSEGNLAGLAYNTFEINDFCSSDFPRQSSFRHTKSMLQSAPSFSIFNLEVQDEENQQEDANTEALTRTATIGESVEDIDCGADFSFVRKGMGLIEENEEEEEEEEELISTKNVSFEGEVEPASPPMYLATGYGIDAFGLGSGSNVTVDLLSLANFDESNDAEEYYKKLVDEFPCHPFFLRNYAQLLQSKGNLHEAEEYYFRATLADPQDGEILFQYAKLVWELHHDQAKASSYFERAVQAAPHDNHVLAAYASFLWETEEDKQSAEPYQNEIKIQDEERENKQVDFGNSDSIEEYYKKMIEENPNDPLFLKNYAQFLRQTKGDLEGAEEYYSRAILADPEDGKVLSEYAKLVWEFQHDHNRASYYFERAAQASPEDSHVLAAYASFLWETEEDDVKQTFFQVPGAIATANA